MYLKIDGIDFSNYCSDYSVDSGANYNSKTCAGGNTVVDYINSKTEIQAKIIALDAEVAKTLVEIARRFSVSVEYLNPATNTIATSTFIIPSCTNDYYTITADKTMLKAFKIKLKEL